MTHRLVRLSILMLFTLMMASCVTISFDQPQPQRAQILDKFPSEMTGIWIEEEGDSLIFTENEFSTSLISGRLDGMNILKEEEGMYFFNLREDDFYMVFMGKFKSSNELEVFWFDMDDENTIANLKAVCPVEEFLDAKGDVERYHFSPSVSQFQEIIDKRMYSSMGIFSK